LDCAGAAGAAAGSPPGIFSRKFAFFAGFATLAKYQKHAQLPSTPDSRRILPPFFKGCRQRETFQIAGELPLFFKQI
jgi:hypothetical protein